MVAKISASLPGNSDLMMTTVRCTRMYFLGTCTRHSRSEPGDGGGFADRGIGCHYETTHYKSFHICTTTMQFIQGAVYEDSGSRFRGTMSTMVKFEIILAQAFRRPPGLGRIYLENGQVSAFALGMLLGMSTTSG